LNALRAEAKGFRNSALANSTKKTYRSQLKSYLSFCNLYRVEPVPASQETLTSYMAFLARSLSANSIQGYMNVIRLLHLESGFSNPLEENWDLKMTFKGISRQMGQPPKQKSPVTAQILLLLHGTLDDSPIDHAFWCGCLIAYYGFLRKSSLLPPNGPLLSDKYIARKDVTNVTLSSFAVVIKNSKTIQFGQRVHRVEYASCADPRLCPVRALFTQLGRSPLPATSPLFNFLEQSSEVRFTHAMFMKRLKSGLRSVGLNSTEYSCHSFRRGGATLAFAAGMSTIDIKMRGDWASNAFESYVFIAPTQALESARLLTATAANLV
jgi:integrase